MNETQQTAERVPPRPHFHIGQIVTYRGSTYLIDDLQPVLPGPVWCAYLTGPDTYFVVPCAVLGRATVRQEADFWKAVCTS